MPIRDLWKLAYDRLRKEDEQLIKNYEAKISKNLSASISEAIDSKISVRDQMDIVLRSKMDEVNQNSWKLRFGSSEVQVKDLAQPILGVVNWANEYMSGALTPNPCASMAWAGISLLLPVSGLGHISHARLWDTNCLLIVQALSESLEAGCLAGEGPAGYFGPARPESYAGRSLRPAIRGESSY